MRFGRKREERPPADQTLSETLRTLVYGDAPMAQWPTGDAPDGEPWTSFVRARQAYAAGRDDEAVRLWLGIARTPGAESRCVLQAWTFLRRAGQAPAPEEEAVVHGVVCEVPVDGLDVLAAYRDGTARYLNHSGKVVIVEERWPETADLLRVAEPLGDVIGVWEERTLPPLPPGHARLLLLTPGGFRFGQGPSEVLFADALAGTVLRAAIPLLARLTGA